MFNFLQLGENLVDSEPGSDIQFCEWIIVPKLTIILHLHDVYVWNTNRLYGHIIIVI